MLNRSTPRLITCTVCDGYAKWHADNGSTCASTSCGRDLTRCNFCNGKGLIRKRDPHPIPVPPLK
jgi:hypothetical protein